MIKLSLPEELKHNETCKKWADEVSNILNSSRIKIKVIHPECAKRILEGTVKEITLQIIMLDLMFGSVTYELME